MTDAAPHGGADGAASDVAPGGLQIGDSAPAVTGRTHHGEELRLDRLAGSPVLVMFYPFAFSRVCGSELAELQARRAELRRLGVRALAVSCDAIHTLRAYAEQLIEAAGEAVDADETATADADRELAVELVSDFWPHGRIAEAFGVFDGERGTATRTSFLLDAELVVRHIQQVPRHRARDLDETLEELGQLSARS